MSRFLFPSEYYDSTYNRKGYVFLSGYDMIFESNKIIDGATYNSNWLLLNCYYSKYPIPK